MTKETKIGLLVGLGFIIVIGILLSDHIQSSTEPPRAQIENAGFTARRAVETPGAGANPLEVATAAPVGPISTADELRNAPAPQSVIKISGPAQTPVIADNTKVVVTRAIDPAPPLRADEDAPLITKLPEPATSGDQGAQTPIVNVLKPVALENIYGGTSTPTAPVAPIKVAMKSYVAAKGDSLSKIAMKFYNDKSPAMIKLIVDANKDLKANPKNLMAGKTYMIPANPKGDSTVATTLLVKNTPTTMPSNKPTLASGNALLTPARSVSTVLYTVKSGDNLWKIATEEVGSAKAIQQIRDLNKDVLNGTDNVKANMKLKIPAKAVASAN